MWKTQDSMTLYLFTEEHLLQEWLRETSIWISHSPLVSARKVTDYCSDFFSLLCRNGNERESVYVFVWVGKKGRRRLSKQLIKYWREGQLKHYPKIHIQIQALFMHKNKSTLESHHHSWTNTNICSSCHVMVFGWNYRRGENDLNWQKCILS